MNRLRLLDALFAERVLCCKVQRDEQGDPICTCNGHPNDIGWHGSKHGSTDGDSSVFWSDLPHYTRSLNAAWEGVDTLDGAGDGCFHLRHAIQGHDLGWHAKFGCGNGIPTIGYGWANHPAEALVIAALRAIGVTEEELKV